MKSLTLILLASLLLSANFFRASAQEESKTYQLKKNHWIISTKDGATQIAMRLISFSHDTLLYESTSRIQTVLIDSILAVTHIQRSQAAKGLAIGGGTGILVGLLVGGIAAGSVPQDDWFAPYERSLYVTGGSTLGLIAGATVGAVIGAAIPKQKVYDLQSLTDSEKDLLLSRLIPAKSK